MSHARCQHAKHVSHPSPHRLRWSDVRAKPDGRTSGREPEGRRNGLGVFGSHRAAAAVGGILRRESEPPTCWSGAILGGPVGGPIMLHGGRVHRWRVPDLRCRPTPSVRGQREDQSQSVGLSRRCLLVRVVVTVMEVRYVGVGVYEFAVFVSVTVSPSRTVGVGMCVVGVIMGVLMRVHRGAVRVFV